MRKAMPYSLIVILLISFIPTVSYAQDGKRSSGEQLVGPPPDSKISRGPQDSFNKEIELLAPYLAQPRKKITATVKGDRLLNEADVYALRPDARITEAWFAAEVQGHILQSTHRELQGATLSETLEKFRAAADLMVPILERTKPDPNIIIPKGADYGIQAFMVEGSASEILSVRQAVPNSSIVEVSPLGESLSTQKENIPSAPKVERQVEALQSENAVVADNTPRKYLPNRGFIVTGSTFRGNTEYRYLQQWVQWDNPDSITDFKEFGLLGVLGNEVYEHQFLLNKDTQRSPGTYFREYGEFIRPEWNASWDNGYLDTQILNGRRAGSSTEADFTIGTYYPRRLKAGQWYYLWALFDKGDANFDEAKLTGQAKGMPPVCPGLPRYYCVLGDSITQWIVNAWKITVPAPNGATWLRPQITSTENLTTPVANQQFYIRIKGGGFDPNTARVLVKGPGCPDDKLCVVPIDVLKSSGAVTNTEIAKVPLTLSTGDYKVYVLNTPQYLPRDSESQMFKQQLESEGFSLTVQPPPVSTPAITGLDYMSAPVAGTQFIVRLKGIRFDPSRVRVVMTGPGCQSFGACTVSNSTLKDFGAVSATLIERVPLTLSAGSYNLYVQNGSSTNDPVSQSTGVTVSAPVNDPVITAVTYLTTPLSGTQFTVRVDGRYFDTNLVRLVVTGPGCSSFGACSVPNNVLKSFGNISSTQLPKVPLTLGAGNYQVYVQNGTSTASRVSSGYTITVNEPVITLDFTRITLLTTPVRGKQFFSKLEGRGFDTNQVRVVVTGPGCSSFSSCVIPNNVLKSFGTVSTTLLSNVPMTLGAGTYQVYIQNGTSLRDPVSRSIPISVN